MENISSDELLGVDVGVTKDGSYQIVEANRAPEWMAFEKAVGFNMAQKIVEKIYHRALEGGTGSLHHSGAE